jgi:hypothetical protein
MRILGYKHLLKRAREWRVPDLVQTRQKCDWLVKHRELNAFGYPRTPRQKRLGGQRVR